MSKNHVHDPDLLDVLEQLEPKVFEGSVWRIAWKSRNVLAAGTGGGRWHPPNDFEALYTSLDKVGAVAEVYYHLSKAPILSSSEVRLSRIAVKTKRTLFFDDVEALQVLGITEQAFYRGDHTRSRDVGAAARFLDIDGLVVPSARWKCSNLVLFLDRLSDLETLKVKSTTKVNWPAWRERIMGKSPSR